MVNVEIGATYEIKGADALRCSLCGKGLVDYLPRTDEWVCPEWHKHKAHGKITLERVPDA